IPPIAIPLDENEHFDEKLLRSHVDFVIDGGCSSILAFGSNGEFYMQEEDEMKDILDVIIDQTANRVPVFMGIGAIRTSKCVRLARLGIDHGAKAVSILQPMFLKPSEDELYTHFKTIAENVPEVPVLLYNNPGRTGYGISQDVVQRLAHETENIVGMKDSSGDITQTEEFIRRNLDVDFKVMCGKDTLIYAGLCVGAVGAVCCMANFVPKMVCSIYDAYVKGDLKGSLKNQFALNPIRLQMDKSSFPVATKDYGNLLGRKLGSPYLPTKNSTPSQLEGLKARLEEAGLLN
ncbi:MAG: dihydrodipicolinate synthase family protein, partial [Sphaerochaetaceae bacterium]|nr:dihydrodipicolinate synthase family protein [Sphaerochaetaceae bacterium]